MGGHGGLNILPQKRWNVYNYDNRERVRKDKEKYREWRETHDKKQTFEKLAQKRETLKGETDVPRSNITLEMEQKMEEGPAPGEPGFKWRDKKHLPSDGYSLCTKSTQEVPWYAQSKGERDSKEETRRQGRGYFDDPMPKTEREAEELRAEDRMSWHRKKQSHRRSGEFNLCDRIRKFRSKQSTMGSQTRISGSSTESDSSVSRSRSRSSEKCLFDSKQKRGILSSTSDEAESRPKRGSEESEDRQWAPQIASWHLNAKTDDGKKVTSSGKTIEELRMEREVRLVIEREKTARLLKQQKEQVRLGPDYDF